MAQSSGSNSNSRSRFFGRLQLFAIVGIIIIAIIFARAPDRIEHRATSSASVEDVIMPSVPVITVPRQEDFTLPIKITGNVSLQKEITVMPEAKGRVIWVSDKFRSGETVSANEVLVKIDPAEYLSRVKEIKARLELKKLQPDDDSDSEESRTSKRRARIDLLEAKLERAQRQLEQTSISLPFEFRVTHSDIAVGELAGPFEYVGPDAAVLGTGYRVEDLQVSGPIEPYRVENLNPLIGRSVTIRANNSDHAAKVARVTNVISLETRMIHLFFEFDEDAPSESLPLPGTFAEISIEGPTFKNAFVLPARARQIDSTAWVVENGLLASRLPNTLLMTGELWIVEPFDIASGVVVGNLPGISIGTAVAAVPWN